MAQAVIMPKLGQTMEEGTIVKWHKKAGDAVAKGDILFEMETDKAVLEAESFYEGILLKVYVDEGATVPVNVTVAYIGAPGEKVPDTAPAAPAAAAPPTPEVGAQKSEVGAGSREPAAARPLAAAAAPSPAPAPRPAAPAAPAAPARVFISPRAKALARDCVIDPSRIKGTGPGGRIVERDVRAHLDQYGYAGIRISPAAKTLAAKEHIDILSVRGTGDGGRIVMQDIERAVAMKPRTMSKIRQVIARRLTESFTTTPHFYVTVSVDMTDLMALRKELKDRGKVFTVTDFILESVILALQEFPVVNSVTDGTTVRWHGGVHLGMAVSVEQGLVVPPIRDAENLSMVELHDRAQALAAKAREGKLLPDEMTGSTFTVSNMGMLNVENFQAIINPGEGAILAVASTIESAVVRGGQVCVRSIMKITLSCDHRIVDGATGAAFVNAIKAKLEDMELWKRLTS